MPSHLKKLKHIYKSQEGAALFLAVMLLGFIFVLGAIITKIQLRELKFGIRESDSTKALFAADAGIERALYYIYQETAVVPETCITTGCFIPLTALDNGASYHVIVPYGSSTPIVVDANTEYIVLRSIGSSQTIERSIEVNLYTKKL
ncbi:hypothetical protein D4R86_01565 [bacterium]|nr:MAG: hypothetical protein D4R86_01565 [bacterium]